MKVNRISDTHDRVVESSEDDRTTQQPSVGRRLRESAFIEA